MRAIDADKLIEEFNEIENKDYTAIFVKTIIEIIQEQPTLAPDNGPSEIVINAKAWDELPVDVKAKLLMAVRNHEVCVMGYNNQLIKGGNNAN